jgi:hypothetical protein
VIPRRVFSIELTRAGLALQPGPRSASLLLLVCVLALCFGGCSREQPLANAHRSSSDLARAVLDGLAGRDASELRSLAVNEAEFKEHVWPQLPAARPERNLPFSYVWGDLHQKSEQALRRALATYGGHRLELVDVTFEGDTDYVSYRVHRAATLVVRNTSGQQSTIRVCGSMLEEKGAWKIFSYVVDE